MTLDLLRAHPDLVTHLDPDAGRRCPVRVGERHGVVTWRCHFPARWQVKGHPDPLCGLHAAPTLRRLLLEQDERGGS